MQSPPPGFGSEGCGVCVGSFLFLLLSLGLSSVYTLKVVHENNYIGLNGLLSREYINTWDKAV